MRAGRVPRTLLKLLLLRRERLMRGRRLLCCRRLRLRLRWLLQRDTSSLTGALSRGRRLGGRLGGGGAAGSGKLLLVAVIELREVRLAAPRLRLLLLPLHLCRARERARPVVIGGLLHRRVRDERCRVLRRRPVGGGAARTARSAGRSHQSALED